MGEKTGVTEITQETECNPSEMVVARNKVMPVRIEMDKLESCLKI